MMGDHGVDDTGSRRKRVAAIRFSLEQPIFAVCSLSILLTGVVVIPTLPIAQFPRMTLSAASKERRSAYSPAAGFWGLTNSDWPSGYSTKLYRP
jgi:hypothetical protein